MENHNPFRYFKTLPEIIRLAALKFLKKIMKLYGKPLEIVKDRLRSSRVAMKAIGKAEVKRLAGGRRIVVKTPTCHFDEVSRRC